MLILSTNHVTLEPSLDLPLLQVSLTAIRRDKDEYFGYLYVVTSE